MKAFYSLLFRELKLTVREGSTLGTTLGFYLLVVALLPLGLGPDRQLFGEVAPGLLWIALLLSSLLSLGRLFESDYEDGSLELFSMESLPLELVVAAKALSHWISTSIPLSIIAPILGVLLNLNPKVYPDLVLTMLVGTPAISFLGTFGAALTLQTHRGGLLLPLLVLPFYVPTLIFGIGAIADNTLFLEQTEQSLLLLLAMSMGALVIGPFAAAFAIRYQMR